MAYAHTAKEIRDALHELRIRPLDGKVNSQEAARILSWRAKVEQGVDHEYNDMSIRRHVFHGHLTPIPMSIRYNMYKVEDLFDLPLAPRRQRKQKAQDPRRVDRADAQAV